MAVNDRVQICAFLHFSVNMGEARNGLSKSGDLLVYTRQGYLC